MTHPDNPRQNSLPAAEPKAWLQHFPEQTRRLLGQWFSELTRSGVTSPDRLVYLVGQRAAQQPQQSTLSRAQLRRAKRERRGSAVTLTGLSLKPAPGYDLVLTWIHDDRPGALLYAQHSIDFADLDPEAQKHVKAELDHHRWVKARARRVRP